LSPKTQPNLNSIYRNPNPTTTNSCFMKQLRALLRDSHHFIRLKQIQVQL